MMTMAELFDQLTAEGALDPATPGRAATALAGRLEDRTPWYLHLLVGIGSLIAAVMLMAFFGMTNLTSSGWATLALGLALCGVSTGLRFAVARLSALSQAPLALCLAGELLTFVGVLSIGGFGLLSPGGDASFSRALAGLAALELALIVVYRDPLRRFLSTVIAAVALCWLLLANDLQPLAAVLAAGLGWAAALAWQHERALSRRADLARPVAYGLVLALFTTVWMLLLADARACWPASIGLAAALAYQGWRLSAGASVALRGAAVAGALLLLPLAWASPGLLAAPLVLLVGFSRGSRIVTGLGGLFLAGYIIFYYYNLDLSLLAKSFSLMGAGVALLGARAALARLKRI